jgi:ABC-type multidrug transport system ATPase subunit
VRNARLEGVWKRFETRAVLQDFSASFDEGVSLLVGPNGSGKTTILGLLAGVIAADSGTVRVLDAPVDSAKGRVFLAPSAAPAIPWLSGRAFVEFATGLFETRMPREGTQAILDGFGLASHLDKPLGEMSSGTAKKVVIASAFASGAPVLLFDEPTNELDAGSIAFFLDLVRGAAGKVIVVATHHADQFAAPTRAVVRLDLPGQSRGER